MHGKGGPVGRLLGLKVGWYGCASCAAMGSFPFRCGGILFNLAQHSGCQAAYTEASACNACNSGDCGSNSLSFYGQCALAAKSCCNMPCYSIILLVTCVLMIEQQGGLHNHTALLYSKEPDTASSVKSQG